MACVPMTVNLARLSEYPVVAVDTECTGLHWYRDRMFGVAVAVYDGKSVRSQYWDIRQHPSVVTALKLELPHCKKVVNHHIKFDYHFLLNEGIKLPEDRMECTMVRAALINEHEGLHGHDGFDLDSLCSKYIKEGKVDIWTELASSFGGAPTRSAQIKNLHRAPSSVVAKYAAPDPALALRLWLWQEEEIRNQDLGKIWALERALTPVLCRIERQGVRVNLDRTHDSLREMRAKIKASQRVLNKAIGKEFNVNSTPQMRALFQPKKWNDDNWYVGKIRLEKTDGGEPSINKDALRLLAASGQTLAGHIMEVRKLLKAEQFLSKHILGHEVGGVLYPNYNQTRGDNEMGTGTGRFSINDPALQQIPKRDEDIAAIVRSCFIAAKGHKWCSADWDQFEFRWFAHYVKDPNINAAYAKDPDTDFHGIVAKIIGISRDPRHAGDANAKQINLGLVFGMGEGRMAAEMGLDYEVRTRGKVEYYIAGEKAKSVFAAYHGEIPGVRRLLEKASSIATSRGHVKTAMGRHIRFPGGKYTHKAGGLVFQGTSADCMKQKMIEFDPICRERGWQYLLSVHDEHNLSIPEKETKDKKTLALIQEVVQTFDGERCPIKCDIPIRSSIEFGDNWWQACK